MENVIKFKTKQEQQEEEIQNLIKRASEVMPMKDVERYTKFVRGQELTGYDRLLFSNMLVRTKFDLKRAYKELDRAYQYRKIVKNKPELESADMLLDYWKKFIYNQGELLVTIIFPNLDKYFTLKEIVQIVSGSKVKFKEALEKDKELDSLNLVFVHSVEYRHDKQKNSPLYMAEHSEMPLFYALVEYFCTKKYPQEMEDGLINMFLGECMIDLVTGEKLIQRVNVKELIQNYRGAFITELKSSKSINLEEKYRLKSFFNGSYAIIDDEGNILHKIYSK